MSASSDGPSIGNGTKLEPLYPRSTHAQIAYEECLQNQIAQLLAENHREAEEIATGARRRSSNEGDARLKQTPNALTLSSCSLTADDAVKSKAQDRSTRNVQGKKNSKDEHKSRRSRSGRRKRRHNILMVNMTKARSSGEVLRVSLNELGWRWKESSGIQRVPCDLFWNGVSFFDCENKPLGGMVNKFPGLLELVRKAQLSKLLHQMRQLFPDEYSFYPRTWILPEQYHIFCAEVSTFIQKYPRAKPVFIVKPDDGSQGDGIYLISNPHHMSTTGLTKPAVVQEYVPRPLLLEHLKFDLRIYVLLASIDPLRIYICKEGMARFCTIPYQEPTTRNLHVTYMHLTNYSLNKFSTSFVHTDATDRGSKRTMTSVFGTLANRGLDTPRMWEEIQELVVKTITAMLPDLRVVWEAELPPKRSNPSCFQILGFDILLTSKLKPILLEVNANPSLRLDFEHHLPNGLVEILPSPVDEEIKIPLITDILRLLRPGKSSKNPKSAASIMAAKRNQIPVVSLDVGDVPNHRLDEPTSEDEEDPLYDSCLEEIWPRKFGTNYEHLRIMERVAVFFNLFLGVRGAHRMGATGFRTFCRKCKLCGGGFSTAAADIMYIDVARRWNERTCEGVAAGMCFGAFLEAFFLIAKRKMRGDTLCERVVALVEHCEVNLKDNQDWQPKKPLPHRRLGRPSMAGRTLAQKNSSEN
ncbi:tubulin polyglutamylase TTLL11-like [Lytechinus variegatus]|uniref:tubulin polyglutamylase TTLL11-like n=1 Tax=Lytechinus variegatus TaxID=7654 RepID=UPI001BB22156|nr:tubulin polyglutamylase TTLL11-like [Lytechinus variegatus]